MSDIAPHKTPWHLWLVGVLGVLWNGFGAVDYFMTKTQGDPYMRSVGMTDAQIAHMHAMPAFMTVIWAVGVWGALLGTILLLLRKRLAVGVFIASCAAFVLSVIYGYFINPMPGAGASMMVMNAVIFVGCLFFIWYAARMAKAGVLR